MKKTTVVDVTPTWAEILPVLLLLLERGDAVGRETATDELGRMARIADEAVSAQKSRDAWQGRLAETTRKDQLNKDRNGPFA